MNKHFTQRPYKKINAKNNFNWFKSFFYMWLVGSMILISIEVSNNTKQIENLINKTKEIRVEQQEVKEVILSEGDIKETIKDKITIMSVFYEVDTQTALDIAECESQFDPLAKNPKSSAKGVYQFIDSTWEEKCSGDVMNEDDNIKCFMELYNKYPHYWDECNVIIK